jgi:FdhE protein
MSYEAKPHLEEVLALYEKIREFGEAVKLRYDYGPLSESYHCYLKEDIDTVLNAFSEAFEVPPEGLRDDMLSNKVDFMLLRNAGEVPSREMFSLLYILGKPFFRSMKDSLNVDDIYWQEGLCPVCGATPSLSAIEKDAERKYYCTFCETMGRYKRIGCNYCHSEDAPETDIIYVENEEGVRVDACKSCMSYIKTVQLDVSTGRSVEETDLLSLPLDIVAQGKGFIRRSPNPAGIVRFD